MSKIKTGVFSVSRLRFGAGRLLEVVYATCPRTLGHVADAEDTAQDRFVQLAGR